jgi:F-box-like
VPELLSHIFLIRVLDDKTDYDFNFRVGSLSSWHTVLHVCSRWRAIAMGTPSLWACWNFTNSRWQAISLRNSKVVDIYIRSTVTSNALHADMKTMLGNPKVVQRIRELHLKGENWRVSDCVKTFLATTQRGDHVKYRMDSIMVMGEHLHDTYTIPVPSGSSSYGCRLRRFDLHGCGQDFPLQIVHSFVSLTYLGLHTIKIEDETSLPSLLYILKMNPHLKTLKLVLLSSGNLTVAMQHYAGSHKYMTVV